MVVASCWQTKQTQFVLVGFIAVFVKSDIIFICINGHGEINLSLCLRFKLLETFKISCFFLYDRNRISSLLLLLCCVEMRKTRFQMEIMTCIKSSFSSICFEK
uniref:Uncharacterized protein n=1 Tax=Proboscia inermis TaxID=420281 RepID=A0A7S0CIR6_9STRA